MGGILSGSVNVELQDKSQTKSAMVTPRLGDLTYAAMISKERFCSQLSCCILCCLFSITPQADGQMAITIKAEDSWITTLLSAECNIFSLSLAFCPGSPPAAGSGACRWRNGAWCYLKTFCSCMCIRGA